MIVSMQININHCRVWLFYNEMGAVAQCPNNWGVGSAFHPKKIHILVLTQLGDIETFQTHSDFMI